MAFDSSAAYSIVQTDSGQELYEQGGTYYKRFSPYDAVSPPLRYNQQYDTSIAAAALAGGIAASLAVDGTGLAGLALVNTFTGQNTIAQGTLTASKPFTWTQTWNNAGVVFTGLNLNVTDTASDGASLLADFQVGGTTRAALTKGGNLGVGIAAPAQLLHVYSNSGSAGPSVLAECGASASVAKLLLKSNSANFGFYVATGLNALIAYDYAAPAERFRVDSAGNFCFGGTSVGGGAKVVFLTNAATPPSTNPSGGGVLYAEGGALKWRGSSGTVTTIAAA